MTRHPRKSTFLACAHPRETTLLALALAAMLAAGLVLALSACVGKPAGSNPAAPGSAGSGSAGPGPGASGAGAPQGATGGGQDIGTLTPGVITVGADTSFPPFENKTDGTVEGFDVDLGNALASRLSVQWRVVTVGWEALEAGLAAGKYDAIMSAMPVTAERRSRMGVSTPYMDVGQSIVVLKGTPIKDEAGLRGKRVGAAVGSKGQSEAQRVLGPGSKNLRLYNDTTPAFQDLKARRVDAVIADTPSALYTIKTTYPGQMVVAKTLETGEAYAIFFKKGNSKLAAALDRALAEAKAGGEYARVYEKWFGVAPK